MEEMLINDGWSFHKENEAEENISIPHTYNSADGQSGTSMWRGKGYYKRELVFREEDREKTIYLEIGAAAMRSTVYINGKNIYENTCPYAMYRVALNEHITEGINLLELVVDNTATDAIYPQMADFSFYGGIYRDVKLVYAPKVHFDYLDGSRSGVQVRTKKLDEGKWEVKAEGCVINEGSMCAGQVKISLVDKENIVSEKTIQFSFAEKTPFSVQQEISDPHLWMGTERSVFISSSY